MRRVYWLLTSFSLIGLVGGILLLPAHFSLLDLLATGLVFGVLPLGGAIVIGRQIAPPPSALPRVLLVAATAAGCVISLRSILAFPNFSATDEAIIVNYIDTFKRSGHIEASLVPYDSPIVTGNLYVYAGAVWAGWFPDDPYAMRKLSMLGGLALIGVVFLVGRSLHDALTGWIAAALMATNLLWMAVSHVGRQEIWLSAFVWGAMWLSLAAQNRQSARFALLAGLVVALSADVHPLGAYAALALGLWWVYRMRTRAHSRPPLPPRLFIMFILGGLLGAGYYATAHILPDPARFVAALHEEATSYGAEGWTPPAAMLARHLGYLLANPVEFGLLIAGVWSGVRRARHLGIFLGALALLYASTVADPNPYYPVVWITGAVILAAAAARHAAWHWRAPLAVAFSAVFALNVGLVERQVRADWNGRALDAIQQVAAVVPPGQRGLGESFLYLALRDSRYTGFTFINFQAEHTGSDQWSLVEALAPDWIVTLSDEATFAPEYDYLSVAQPHLRLEIPEAALENDYRRDETRVGGFEIWRRDR